MYGSGSKKNVSDSSAERRGGVDLVDRPGEDRVPEGFAARLDQQSAGLAAGALAHDHHPVQGGIVALGVEPPAHLAERSPDRQRRRRQRIAGRIEHDPELVGGAERRIAAERVEHRDPDLGARPEPVDEHDRDLAGLVRVQGVDARPLVVELGIEHAQVFVVPDRALSQPDRHRGGQVGGHREDSPVQVDLVGAGRVEEHHLDGPVAQLAADPRGRITAVAANVALRGPNGSHSAISESSKLRCTINGTPSPPRRPFGLRPVTIRSSAGTSDVNPIDVHSGTSEAVTIPAAASRSGHPPRPGADVVRASRRQRSTARLCTARAAHQVASRPSLLPMFDRQNAA